MDGTGQSGSSSHDHGSLWCGWVLTPTLPGGLVQRGQQWELRTSPRPVSGTPDTQIPAGSSFHACCLLLGARRGSLAPAFCRICRGWSCSQPRGCVLVGSASKPWDCVPVLGLYPCRISLQTPGLCPCRICLQTPGLCPCPGTVPLQDLPQCPQLWEAVGWPQGM